MWTSVICLMTVENDITFFIHIMQTDCKYNCNILYCLNQFHDIQFSDTVQYYVTCMVETDFLVMPLLFSFPLKLITRPSDQYMTAFSIMHLWLNQITKKSLSGNQSNSDRELVVSSILSALPVLNNLPLSVTLDLFIWVHGHKLTCSRMRAKYSPRQG